MKKNFLRILGISIGGIIGGIIGYFMSPEVMNAATFCMVAYLVFLKK